MADVRYGAHLGAGVWAVGSDRSLDFFKGAPGEAEGFVLTPLQRDWLSSRKIASPHKLIFPKQVHGREIWTVTEADVRVRGIHEADAVITTAVGLPIAIRTADCLPLLLYAPKRRVIAAVHAGWKSTQLEIARYTIEALVRDHGVDPKEIKAAIGPCIRRESCQVGVEFKEYFPQDVVEAKDGLHFDIAAANIRQLTGAGVLPQHIYDCGLDTLSDPGFHSFRRDGDKSGRMVHVIMLV